MNLRTWRLEAEKSQDVVSGLLGVTQAYYSKLELGKRRASPELAQRIARMTKGKVKMITRETKA